MDEARKNGSRANSSSRRGEPGDDVTNALAPSRLSALRLGHIDKGQVLRMAAFILGTKAFLMTPSLLAAKVGSSAWIATLLGAAVAALGFWGWAKWSEITSGLAAIPALRFTLGRFLGDFVGLILLVFSILNASLNIRVQAGGAIIGLLPQFPIEVLIMVALVCGMYSAWLGLEPVARLSTIYAPLVVVSIVAVIAGTSRTFDIRNLYPIWGMGFGETIRGGLLASGLFSAVAVVLVWKSYSRDHIDLVKGGFGGIAAAGLAIALACAASAIIFPYPEVTRPVTPLGEMARAVYLGPFLQRLEAPFTFVWFFSTVTHASILLISILILLAQLSGTESYRPFVPALTSLIFAIAAIPASLYRASTLLQSGVFEFSGPGLVALGWILYIVARIRGVSYRDD